MLTNRRQQSPLRTLKVLFKYALLASAVTLCSWFVYLLRCDHSQDKAYEMVARGDSEERVVGFLGHPLRVTGPPANVSWNSDGSVHPNNGECIREYWYQPSLSIAGESMRIGFDKPGKVVSKYYYVSP